MPARRALLVFVLALVSLFSPRPAAASLVTRLPTFDLVFRISVLQRVWAYDGARIVAEFDGTGAMLARFVYGTRPNVPDYMLKGGELYRILSDHLGSVRLVVKVSDGSIAQQLKYDPWGAIELDTSPGFQPFAFAGGLYDGDTKLLRFGARDYDPATGRWTAKDPSGFAGGDNLYVYADDDPVNRLDLNGRNPVLVAALFGAAVGAGEDLFFQMAIGGKSWDCVDKVELLASALLGAITEGAGAGIAQATAKGGTGGARRILFHYTDAPESSFSRGLWSHSSVTNTPSLTAQEAVEQLGLKTVPDKIIPIVDRGHFIPNRPFVVQPHPLGRGGGADFINPKPVPPGDIRPAIPILKP